MPRTLTWLHLSDLHACPRDGWELKPVTDSLVADLRDVSKKHHLQPDIIFFTGDAAWGNHASAKAKLADQFDFAHGFFEKVRKVFEPAIDPRRIYLVPGNHDVDRTQVLKFVTRHLDEVSLEELTTDFRDGGPNLEAYMKRLHEYRTFLTSRGYQHLATDPERLIYADVFNHLEKDEPDEAAVRVGVAGFNSAWTCCREEEGGKLRLCGDFQNKTLAAQLTDAAVRIALIHHPINWLKKDEDPEILRVLQEDFHFLLHGHEHAPHVLQLNGHTTISAGACYEGRRRPNGYNFVRLDLRKGEGRVFARATPTNGRGWGPDVNAKSAPEGIWSITCPHMAAPGSPAPSRTTAFEPTGIESRKAPEASRADDDYETRLREALRTTHNYLDLPGIAVSAEEAKNYDLSVAYVSLSLASSLEDGENPNRRAEELLDALPETSPRLLITGPAGCGKTTLMRWITVEAAGSIFLRRPRQGFPHLGGGKTTFKLKPKRDPVGPVALRWHFTGGDDFVVQQLPPANDWRTKLPILIRLRDFAGGRLPGLRDIPKYLAKFLAEPAPDFFPNVLNEGTAIILLDGMDEVPPDHRPGLMREIETWMNTYPECHYLISSRPDAVPTDWLSRMKIVSADVQPLSPADRESFIDHWHQAVGRQCRKAGKPDDTEAAGLSLKKQLRNNPPVARLTTNPLLAASICALHLDGKAQLPRNEGEVCNKLCELLLDLRDKHQHLVRKEDFHWGGYELLDYDPHKKAILSDIACAMIENGVSSLPEDGVDTRIKGILEKYEPLRRLDPKMIRKALIQRSGLLRVGASETIEFIHNTFKEFLAAERWVSMGEKEVLSHAQHAADPAWQPVIRFSALRATAASGIADRLVEKVLALHPIPRAGVAHGLGEKVLLMPWARRRRRRGSSARAHFLLVQIAAAAALSPTLQEKVTDLRKSLLPPSTWADAEAIGACGEAAIPELVFNPAHSALQRAACVRALGTMEVAAADEALNGYLNDEQSTVLSELSRYRNALSFSHVQMVIQETGEIPGWCSREQINDLTPLSGLTSLQRLDLDRCTAVSDLAPLSAFASLQMLRLGCAGVSDLTPLSGLAALRQLYLMDCTGVSNLAPLSALASLEELYLIDCTAVSNLAALSALASLQGLSLGGCTGVSDLAPLSKLGSLRWLDLFHCTNVSDLVPLSALAPLQQLYLYGCTGVSRGAVTALRKSLPNLRVHI